MSNFLAIAAVTTTLRDRIARAVGAGVEVVSAPPDRVRAGAAATGARVNLFLYQIAPNASLRNMDMSRTGFGGGSSPDIRTTPPLALNLHYLLTAYGDADSETDAQRLMALSMLALNDQPLLELDEIRDATAASLADNDLDRQIERVRLTLMPLTTDDFYKLWSGFQTPFRASVAYEARLVLIDTKLPARNVLPVLTIGKFNSGVDVRAGPGPLLDEIHCMSGPSVPATETRPVVLPAARVGDHIRLVGSNIGAGSLTARFTPLPPIGSISADPASPVALQIIRPVEPSSAGPVVNLAANAGTAWVAGVYNVEVIQKRGAFVPLLSNAVPMQLAPSIKAGSIRVSGSAANNTVAVTVGFAPPLLPQQRATLMVGGLTSEAPLTPVRAGNVETLKFKFPGAARTADAQTVRLRVDGIDSIPVDPTNLGRFDPNQQVKIPQ